MNRRVILSLLLPVCTFLTVVGQTKSVADSDDVVRITTNLVQIDAVVTKNGKLVTNLTPEDFEIYEDGVRQTITSFAYISNVSGATSNPPDKRESSAPDKRATALPPAPIKRDAARRTIAIVVDDLGLSAESMNQSRRQLRKFIAQELQPNDLVAIIRTGGEMGALQQFTNDKRLLNRAVDQLRWNYCSRLGINVLQRVGDVGTADTCGGSVIFRTMKALLYVVDVMGQLPGRKSLVLMSDDIPMRRNQNGDDIDVEDVSSITVGTASTNLYTYLRKIAEQAIRSSVVIYSVDTQGLQFTGITAADSISGSIPQRTPRLPDLLSGRSLTLQTRREGSEFLARQTGGFQVRNSNNFQLDNIVEDQSGYYLLGYRPTEETFNRRFHHIKAKVKRSGMTLRTRSGFYGVTEEETKRARPTVRDETNLALLSPFGRQDLEVDVNSFFAGGKAEAATVRSFVYLNPANLSFVPVNGRHEAALEIHGVIFGDNGSIVNKVKHDIVLSMADGEYEQAIRDGLPDSVRLRFDMPAKRAGSYQVRIAVRDRTSSKIGSAGQFVAVPDLESKDKRTALSGIVLQGSDDAVSQTTVMTTPPGRRFRANADLNFAFLIYNAPFDPATQSPNLMMETKLFREGRIVGPAAQTTIDVRNQSDLARLFVNGVVRLTSDLEPGNYYLQVAITDKAARDQQPPVIQWADFEIVK